MRSFYSFWYSFFLVFCADISETNFFLCIFLLFQVVPTRIFLRVFTSKFHRFKTKCEEQRELWISSLVHVRNNFKNGQKLFFQFDQTSCEEKFYFWKFEEIGPNLEYLMCSGSVIDTRAIPWLGVSESSSDLARGCLAPWLSVFCSSN